MSTRAQISVDLPETNIRNRSEYQQTFVAGQYSGLLNLLPTISTRANTPNFANVTGGNTNIPLNQARIRLISVGNVSLIGTSNEVVLTNAYQVLGAALANLLSGPVVANIRLITTGFTWRAGTYSTELAFLAPGLLGVGNRISPATQTLNINVPAFISPQTDVSMVSLLVDNLNYYRSSTGISANTSVSLSTSVPYVPRLKAEQAQFNFSTNVSYNRLPTSLITTVGAQLVGIANSSPIFLSTTDQPLAATSGVPVPNDNTQALTTRFVIEADRLKESFVQAGVYSIPVTYTWDKPVSSYPVGGLQVQRTAILEVAVSDMSELVVNHSTVSLNFNSTSDYQMGVSADMQSHLRISKTTPYNLYVRASSENFASGTSTIPLNVLRIGPGSGEASMLTVTLSTTPQQLINAADPVIDRNLNVRYSIPASETHELLEKTAGVYSADIIFSFVAP